MIQNTTFLRRAVGSLLVALVTLVGFQAHAQFDFTATTDIAWAEVDALEGATGGDSLTNLNTRVNEGLTADTASLCYTISGVSALELTGGTECRTDGKTVDTTATPPLPATGMNRNTRNYVKS